MELMELRKSEKVVKDALVAEIVALQSQCTEYQNAFFLRMVPGRLENMTEVNLREVVDLYVRTVSGNRLDEARRKREEVEEEARDKEWEKNGPW